MSLRIQLVSDIPEETKRVARAAFAKGNRYMRVWDELGTWFEDAQFRTVYEL